MSEEKKLSKEEKIEKYLDVMTWYHSEKKEPTGFFATVGRLEEKFNQLNQNIKDANDSSTKLTTALNKITLWGAIIAGIGVAVALANLIFEIFKYFRG